jgi:hypothetical protein
VSESTPPPDEPLTPAEQRLERLLALLRVEPEGGAALPERVVRRARVQLRVKAVAATLVDIAGAIGDTVTFLVGERAGRGRRER